MRRLALLIVLALADGGATAAPSPQEAAPAPKAAGDLRVNGRPWIDPSGTAIVGFGVLRVVPTTAGKPAWFDLRYEEKPGDYGAGSGSEFQLFVLRGDAFATKTNAYADEFKAFTRTKATDDGDYSLKTTFTVNEESTVLVCYGPWTAPDSGRPSGDRPAFRIDVTPHDGTFEWIESEAGELITNNWTNRPGVKRGGVCSRDDPQWVEVRPMILYDGRFVVTPEEAAHDLEAAKVAGGGNQDANEENEDHVNAVLRLQRRIVMTRELAEKFRRVPIRWR